MTHIETGGDPSSTDSRMRSIQLRVRSKVPCRERSSATRGLCGPDLLGQAMLLGVEVAGELGVAMAEDLQHLVDVVKRRAGGGLGDPPRLLEQGLTLGVGGDRR